MDDNNNWWSRSEDKWSIRSLPPWAVRLAGGQQLTGPIVRVAGFLEGRGEEVLVDGKAARIWL